MSPPEAFKPANSSIPHCHSGFPAALNGGPARDPIPSAPFLSPQTPQVGTKSFYFYFWSAPPLCIPLVWTLGKHGFPHLAALRLPLSQLGFYKALGAPAALTSLPSPSASWEERSISAAGGLREGTWPPLTLLSSGTSPSPTDEFGGG